jgi:hypothetical protein
MKLVAMLGESFSRKVAKAPRSADWLTGADVSGEANNRTSVTFFEAMHSQAVCAYEPCPLWHSYYIRF